MALGKGLEFSRQTEGPTSWAGRMWTCPEDRLFWFPGREEEGMLMQDLLESGPELPFHTVKGGPRVWVDISGGLFRSYSLDQTQAQVSQVVPHYTKPKETVPIALNISTKKQQGPGHWRLWEVSPALVDNSINKKTLKHLLEWKGSKDKNNFNLFSDTCIYNLFASKPHNL